jgi:glycosyltransferase involved in cell wall biosynthesis
MPQILFVNLEGRISGAEISLLLMVKHLRNRFKIIVACPGASPLSRELASMRTNLYEVPKPTNHSYSSVLSLAYWLKTSWDLIKIILRVHPDIIHANSFYAGAPAVLAALVTRKKLLLHARDLTGFGFFSKLYGCFCKRIIAISDAVRSALVKDGINPDKIKVIYNGIDNGTFNQPEANRNSFDLPKYYSKNSFIFANVGQFVPWKNHITFLKASSQIAHDLPNARFVLVGDDIFGRNSEYKHSVLSYAKDSPIAERVDFLGWQENMNEVWPKIDCLVHTSEREPFGRVIIEAMANKIPVIAIDSCGPSEILKNGKTGILVQAGDVKGLSEVMLKIAQNTQFANKLVNAGYKYVMSNFIADKTAMQIQEIYTELLAM